MPTSNLCSSFTFAGFALAKFRRSPMSSFRLYNSSAPSSKYSWSFQSPKRTALHGRVRNNGSRCSPVTLYA